MRITSEKIRVIKMELEAALMQYDNYKAGKKIPWEYLPHLQILDEVDVVGAYLNGVIGQRKEHATLKLFLGGLSVEGLIARNGISPAQIMQWVNKFVDFVLERFLQLNEFDDCPFCNQGNVRSSGPAPNVYPLHGRMCFHRELRWVEEEKEYAKE